MPSPHPLAADIRPTPLAAATVTEAVQRIESAGPLDDAAELRQAFHTQATRAAQVQARAWLLGERLGLPHELARWRQVGWLVAGALALLAALSALGLARAVLGEARSINAVAAFVSLLGLHALTLAVWLGALLLPGGGARGTLLGRWTLSLAARLPLDKGPHALTLLTAFTALLRRHRLLGWLTGAISHTVWALAFVLVLAVLAFSFAFHTYALTWETTILSAGFFQCFVQLTGALPALLGFAVPDAAAVQAVGSAAVGEAASHQRAWAWWLLGCVVVYGLLPRVALAALCHWRWRAGMQRLAQVDMGDPQVRRLVARLDALEPPPQVIDPEQRPAAHAAPALPHLPPGAPGTLALIGFELPPESPWPPHGLHAAPTWAERIAGSTAERDAVLARLAQARPESLLLVVHASASPDRGTARFLRQATPQASRTGLLPAGADTREGQGAQRWRDWLTAEGLAVTLVASPPEATAWIASA
ncbi:MAG: DUF2868 domain-containing protein [Pseudomonadota bacterium]|nr:DUF2868 domain-containing protein [Pseudomonadota bacterium]